MQLPGHISTTLRASTSQHVQRMANALQSCYQMRPAKKANVLSLAVQELTQPCEEQNSALLSLANFLLLSLNCNVCKQQRKGLAISMKGQLIKILKWFKQPWVTSVQS